MYETSEKERGALERKNSSKRSTEWISAYNKAIESASSPSEKEFIRLLALPISAKNQTAIHGRVNAFNDIIRKLSLNDLIHLESKLSNNKHSLHKLYRLELRTQFRNNLLKNIQLLILEQDKIYKEKERGTEDRAINETGIKPKIPTDITKPKDNNTKPDKPVKPTKDKATEEEEDEEDETHIPIPPGGFTLPEIGKGGSLEGFTEGGKAWLRKSAELLGYGVGVAGVGMSIFALSDFTVRAAGRAAALKFASSVAESRARAALENKKINPRALTRIIGDAGEAAARVVAELSIETDRQGSNVFSLDKLLPGRNFAGLDFMSQANPIQVKVRGIFTTIVKEEKERIAIKRVNNLIKLIGPNSKKSIQMYSDYARDFMRLWDETRYDYNKGSGGGGAADALMKYRKDLQGRLLWPVSEKLRGKSQVQKWIKDKVILMVPEDHVAGVVRTVSQQLFDKYLKQKLPDMAELTEREAIRRIKSMVSRQVKGIAIDSSSIRLIVNTVINDPEYRDYFDF